jgi:hypothetical protein
VAVKDNHPAAVSPGDEMALKARKTALEKMREELDQQFRAIAERKLQKTGQQKTKQQKAI